MNKQSAGGARIALDGMGGDFSPGSVVEGVRLLEDSFEGRLIIVGRRDEIEACGPLPKCAEIVQADDVVSMHEPPSLALRKKRNSSLAVAVGLVREQRADAVISAGNTGAFMGFSVTLLGRQEGIARPAIATLMPTMKDPCVVLDVGANVDCKPDFLLDFGVMGKVYAEKVLGRPQPRIGLLSIGEEEGKGNELTQAAKELLQNAPLNFVGNVEGRDIPLGAVDVVVCDGFVGNVILKFGEGLCEMIFRQLKAEDQSLDHPEKGNTPLGRAFRRLAAKTDYSEYGGAPLLGVNGICIVCHGKSSPKAIANAIRTAARSIEFGVKESIVEQVSAAHQGE